MTQTQTLWLAAEAATDANWLTQPVATVMAACIALVAASIAYLGVLKTTSTTRRENRRAEKVELLSDGLIAFQNYTRAILQIGFTTDPQVRDDLINRLDAGRIDELNDAISLSVGKLALYGFKDVAKLAGPLSSQLVAAWLVAKSPRQSDIPTQEIAEAHNACVTAFQEAFADLK